MVGLVIGLEIIYVAAGVVILNTQILKKEINSDPQEVLVEWEFAWSPFPGLGLVYNPIVRIQDSNVQMFIQLASARVWVNLEALRHKTFHALLVEGGETRYHLRFRRDPKSIEASRLEALPDIPGLPDIRKPTLKKPDTTDPWKLRFSKINIPHLTEIWIEQYHFSGDVMLNGGFYLFPGKEAEIFQSRIKVNSGEIKVGVSPVMGKMTADIYANIDKFIGDDVPDLEILKYAKGDFSFQSDIDSIRFANYYFSSVKWLELNRGSGNLKGRVKIDHAKVQAGSELTVDAEKLEARMWHQRATGKGKLLWETQEEKGKVVSHLNLHLNHFELVDSRRKNARVDGENLDLRLRSPSLDLRQQQRPLKVHIEMPKLQVSSLTAGNLYLPKDSSVKFLGGNAILHGHFDADTEGTGNDSGLFVAHSENAEVSLGKNMKVKANVDLTAKLNSGSMEKGYLDLAGAKIGINQLFVQGEDQKPWKAEINFPEARITMAEKTSFRVGVDLQSTNARPMIEGVLSVAHTSLPGFIQNLLTMENFKASLRLEADDTRLQMKKVTASGGSFKLKGWMNEIDEEKDGRFLVEYGPLAAGLIMGTDGISVRVQDAYGWWKKQPQAE